jgi:hypothetical protein
MRSLRPGSITPACGTDHHAGIVAAIRKRNKQLLAR